MITSHPGVNSEDILKRVREVSARTVSAGRTSTSSRPILGAPGGVLPEFDEALAEARRHWSVGTQTPAMSKLTGLLRAFAQPAGKVILRIAELVTREQRDFNRSTLQVFERIRGLLQEERLAREQIGRDHEANKSRLKALEMEAHASLLGAADKANQDLKRMQDHETRSRAELTNLVETERMKSEGLLAALRLQEARLTLVLEELRRLPASVVGAESKADLKKMQDSVQSTAYLQFENQFRGSREEIKERVRVYLSTLRQARAGSVGRPILDVGCGRGELLELLQEEDLEGSGIDHNQSMVDQCHQRSLQAQLADGVDFLADIPDESVGAITAIHVLEHLPLESIISFTKHACRILKSGGVLIWETPNPENLQVGASNFWTDPTHIRPLHPEAMKFFTEAQGFVRVEVTRLHPRPVDLPQPDDGPLRRIHALICEKFYGPQDYAIIAFRP